MEINYHFKKKMVIPSKFFHLLVPSNAVSTYLVTGVNWVNWYLKEFPIEQLILGQVYRVEEDIPAEEVAYVKA